MHVTSDEKNHSQNTPEILLKPVLKSGLYYKQISFFTLLTFYGESYLYIIAKLMQSTYDISV